MSFLGRLADMGAERRFRLQHYGYVEKTDDRPRRKFAAKVEKLIADSIAAGLISSRSDALSVFADIIDAQKQARENAIARANTTTPKVWSGNLPERKFSFGHK